MNSPCGSIVVDNEIRGISPVDSAPLAPVPTSSAAQVAEAVQRARAAQTAWEALGFEERVRRLTGAAKRILEQRNQAMKLIALEGGKVPPHALMHEAVGPLEFVKGWTKVIRPYLRPRKLPLSRLSFPGKWG